MRIAGSEQAANPLYLRALLTELRVFGRHEQLDERIDHYLAATAVDALYQRILERYEHDYDPENIGLVRDAMSFLWASRRGLSEAELLDLLGHDGQPLPQAYWLALYLAAEESLMNRGGLIGFSHDYLRRAVVIRYLDCTESRHAAHFRLAHYFAARETGLRVLEELPWQLVQAEDWETLRTLLTNPAFMQAHFNLNSTEYGFFVLTLLDRTGIDAPSLYTRFLREPKSFPLPTLKIVHTILRLTGALDLAETLSGDVVQIAEDLGDPKALANALLMEIGSRKARGTYDYAVLLDRAESNFNNLSDRAELARCLAHRADYEKYHRHDLRAGIAFHQQEERILRELQKLDSLVVCLNNQASTYGRLQEPEKQLALRLETERVARALGDVDLIAMSEANLGMLYLQAAAIQRRCLKQAVSDENLNDAERFLVRLGRLSDNERKGWRLLRSAESRYRVLWKPHSLAGVLRRQIETIHILLLESVIFQEVDIVETAVAIAGPKIDEAYELYLQFGESRRNEVEHLANLRQWMAACLDESRTAQFLTELVSARWQDLPIGETTAGTIQPHDREFAQFILDEEGR